MPFTLYPRGIKAREPSLNAVALGATLHRLTGCAIGEVLGMILGTALGLANVATVALAVAAAARATP
jgi:uncharacterized protein YcfJ